MGLDVTLLILGLALLLVGGSAFVAGASRLAAALGVSELVIGLTVVAFGTSAPELSVNGLAALRGDVAIAFGNVVGSNIANVALVIGLCALVKPLRIESAIVWREIPMMLLASLAALILGLDRIRGAPEAYDRSDGLMFLLLFGVFLYYTIVEVVSQREDPIAGEAAAIAPAASPAGVRRSAALTLAGLVALLLGAELTVVHAVSLAEDLGVSSAVVGLTVVAVGTSLPELVTSIIATWRGQTSLAIGNVVGSNIFNLLFVLAVTAAIRPVPLPEAGGAADLGVMTLFALVLLPLAWIHGFRIVRWAGLLLVAAYLGYVTWRLVL